MSESMNSNAVSGGSTRDNLNIRDVSLSDILDVRFYVEWKLRLWATSSSIIHSPKTIWNTN